MSVADLLKDRKRLIESTIKVRTKNKGVQSLKFVRAQSHYWERRTTMDAIPKSRQLGFSTEVTAEYLTDAATIEGLNVVHVWQSEDEGFDHMSRMIKPMYDSMPDYLEVAGERIQYKPRCELYNRSTITFPELGSSIQVVPAGSVKAMRGKTLHRVHFAEPAFYPPGTFEVMHAAALGAAPSGRIKTIYGYDAPAFRAVAESTANGRGGKWYELIQESINGRNAYKTHFYPFYWDELYEIDEELMSRFGIPQTFEYTDDEQRIISVAKARDNIDIPISLMRLRRLRQLMLPSTWKQEYAEDLQSSFLVPGGMVMNVDVLERLSAMCERVPPVSIEWNGELRVWERPTPGVEYMIAADPSEGLADNSKSASSAAAVIRTDTRTHVATLLGKISPRMFADKLAKLGHMYNDAVLVIERNNSCGGQVLNHVVHSLGYARVYSMPDPISGKRGQLGWLTHKGNKSAMIRDGKEVIEANAFHTYDSTLISQLYNFVENGDYIDAVNGSFTDLAMCTMIGIATLQDRNSGIGAAKPRPNRVRYRY